MSALFPDRVVDAVGACTRTLAGLPDIDAMLASADAATLGGVRAHADRVAVRHRFHDPAIHRRHEPSDVPAALLFTALEQARLDTLGVRWLRGIASNLLAHTGAERDGARWLAFEAFSGHAAPAVKADVVAAARRTLPPQFVDDLTVLATHVDHHDAFATAAADWARRAAPHLPPADDEGVRRPVLPVRRVVRQLPKRGNPGATSAPLRKRARDDEPSDASGGPGNSAHVETDVAMRNYGAYTTAFDRVVNAGALANRAELAQLRTKLDTELSSIRTIVARLAKRLMRVLMARQVREWRFDLDEGLLDGSRLARLVASRGGVRPFKEESESPFPSTVVTLLIDHSGSMRGRPMLIAAITVEIFARVLERCGVRCEVLGFTTRDWDGGEPAREWAAAGYPPNPGRLNALEHIVIKSADMPWRRARVGLGLFLHDEMLKENIDGEAVSWAHRRLLARPERRRILVVVSDGTPMDEATLAANGHEYLERHLQQVIADIETRSPVQLAAIGIGHDVSAFYRNATRIARIDDLGPALTQKLIALLGEDRPRGAT